MAKQNRPADVATSSSSLVVPTELFLNLVWLQAHYASLLNMWDGGQRRAVKLPEDLARHLTDRETSVRGDVYNGEESDGD